VDSDPRTNNVGEGWTNKLFTLVGMVSMRTRHSYNSYTARRHWHPTNKENQPEASAVTETTTEPVVHAALSVVVPHCVGQVGMYRLHKMSRSSRQVLQKRLQNQCNDRISDRKTVVQFLHGVAFNIRLFVLSTYDT
jgi:hypothetical protein